jgi:hypothetical protein
MRAGTTYRSLEAERQGDMSDRSCSYRPGTVSGHKPAKAEAAKAAASSALAKAPVAVALAQTAEKSASIAAQVGSAVGAAAAKEEVPGPPQIEIHKPTAADM